MKSKNFKLLKAHVVDLFEIFSTPPEQRRNVRADMVEEPTLIEISRLAAVQVQTKKDFDDHGFLTTGLFVAPYDLLNIAEDRETMFAVMEAEAKRVRKSKYLLKGKVYRDAKKDYLDCMVRLDLIPILVPCDLLGKQYAEADFRGTAFIMQTGRVMLTDIDYDKAAKLLLSDPDYETDYKPLLDG